MSLETIIDTDVLVIGGGVAGLFASIKAREKGLDVALVDKAHVGNSGASQIASAYYTLFNPEWGNNLDNIMREASIVGEYLVNRTWIEIILNESYARFQDFISWGAPFYSEEGIPIQDYLTKIKRKFAPTHNSPVTQIPMQKRKQLPLLRKHATKIGVRIFDRVMLTDLLKQHDEVVGSIGFSVTNNDLYIFKSKSTVISSGWTGFKSAGGMVWCLTGDGEAMAYRAGVAITGKEFSTTDWTMAAYPVSRGIGGSIAAFAKVIDVDGNEVKRIAMDTRLAHTVHAGKAPIYWDLDSATSDDIEAMREHERRAKSYIEHERAGIDISGGGKIKITGENRAGSSDAGTAGIWPINTKCATNLKGLFAAGDSCGTMRGGARSVPGGYGICGAAVTGTRAGLGAVEYATNIDKPIINEKEISKFKQAVYAPLNRKGGFSPWWVTKFVQSNIIPYFIVDIKHGQRLQAALTMIEFMRDHLVPKLIANDGHELRISHETKNMVLLAEMMLRASLFRTETRGLHYREDYPKRYDPEWLAWVKIKEEKGNMTLSKEPVPKQWWPDLSEPYEKRYPWNTIV